MSTPINKGILQLLELKRLSAVSCASNFSEWKNAARDLKPFTTQINIGLHFNIQKPLFNLIVNAYLRRFKYQKIFQQLQEQYNQFIEHLDHPPAYIDGHQHIHSLPIIREAVTDFCKNHSPKIPTRMLRTKQKTIKSLIIKSLGSKALYKLSVKNNLIFNKDLLGIYNFHNSDKYSTFFNNFLSLCSNNSLIMCHPATSATHEDFRYNELKFLSSNDFINLLNKHRCNIKTL